MRTFRQYIEAISQDYEQQRQPPSEQNVKQAQDPNRLANIVKSMFASINVWEKSRWNGVEAAKQAAQKAIQFVDKMHAYCRKMENSNINNEKRFGLSAEAVFDLHTEMERQYAQAEKWLTAPDHYFTPGSPPPAVGMNAKKAAQPGSDKIEDTKASNFVNVIAILKKFAFKLQETLRQNG